MRLGDVVKEAKGDHWVIGRYYDYVTSHRSVEAERDALVQIMSRPPRVRQRTFSASAAGGCQRERQLAFMGLKKKSPDEKTMNIFANGDFVHLRFQVAGLLGGWLEAAEVSVAIHELNLTGTMDGLLVNGHGLEIKSINSRGFSEVSTFGPKEAHKWQVATYMLARPDIEAFHVVYENKDTQALKEFIVKRDSRMLDKAREELITLNEANNAQALVPMLPECVAGEGRYARCPYREICPTARFISADQLKLPIRLASSTPSDS